MKTASTVRLQRFLAACGLGSRRACEQLIVDGVITVDGRKVTELGTTVEPEHQIVRVRGQQVSAERRIHLALHKPTGVLCTSDDPGGRRTCQHLVRGLGVRLFTVGRLDRDSEGLILMTNDGDFADAMSHPRHEVEKVYRVWTRGAVTPVQARRMEEGLLSEGDALRAEAVRPWRKANAGAPAYEVTLREGRNRHVRRLFKAAGAQVVRLKRVRIGPVRLGDLAAGHWRHLSPEEVRSLRAASRADQE